MQSIYAQSRNLGMGAGLAFQSGVNPQAENLTWTNEHNSISIYPASRVSYGASIYLRSYADLQIEASFLLTESKFEGTQQSFFQSPEILIRDFELPVGLRYNLDSRLKYHSSIVYRVGAILKHRSIPIIDINGENVKYHLGSAYAGIRLSTEISKFGKFEYGFDYVSNINPGKIIQVPGENTQPSRVDVKQATGQLNFVVVYYFMPRIFNWSKQRYSMDSILD